MYGIDLKKSQTFTTEQPCQVVRHAHTPLGEGEIDLELILLFKTLQQTPVEGQSPLCLLAEALQNVAL